ncbi:conjugal transfer protein TraN [Persephonella sp.]
MEILTCKYVGRERGKYRYAVYFAEKGNTICTVVSEKKLHDGDIVMIKEIDYREDIYECQKILDKKPSSLKKILLSLFGILLMLTLKSYSAVICGDNGVVYDDANLCSSVCSIPCSDATLKTTGSSGTCDKNKYQGFVFFNNKTYALSKNTVFWEDFNNLAVIDSQEINSLLAGILSYYNTTAWIGLYDPNQSTSYNQINTSRFIWRDGSVTSYSNWNTGEPNNYLANEDIGVVTVYGEHWTKMDSQGLWYDDGYHKAYGGDYKPRLNALVEWNGPLDCVNAEVPPENSQQDIIDSTCGGNTPCYVCYTNSGFAQCDAGITTFDYNGTTVNLNQYEGQIIVSASGTIDYCFDTVNNVQGCPATDLEALKSWIVFIGDDGNYYWLGNPNNSPVCKGNLNLTMLQYTDNGNSVTITIPQGVRFIQLSDVESLSGECTADNKYNLTITIQPAYLCPQNRVQCDATNEQPLCPEGTLNPDRDMCQADAQIQCPTGYTWDPSIDKCTLQYQCPENGILNKDKDRCQKAFIPDCPSNYTADLTNEVCYKQVDCGIGSFNPALDRCEYPVTKTCPSGFTLNNEDICQAPPSCIPNTTYSTTLDKCISDYTLNCPDGYTWTGSRCETTNIICPSKYSYNASTNRCEAQPTSGGVSPSTCSADLTMYEAAYCIEHKSHGSCTPTSTGCKATVYDSTGNPQTLTFDQNCNITKFNYFPFSVAPGEYKCSSDPSTCVFWGAVVCIKNTSTGGVPTLTCPDGSTPVNGVCIANPSCPSGGNFDGAADVCWLNATQTCPTGTTLNTTLNKCIADPICSSGSSLDTVNDVCWIAYTPSCPTGWSYDAANSICYQSITCDFVYNPTRDRCEATLGKDCGTYTYSSTEDLCIKDISCPTDLNFSLNNTITYDTSLDVCLSEAVHICPSGTSYTYTWNSTPINKCELIPICLNGVYNPQNDLCYLGDFTCPLGSQYQCVTMSDGKNYCSDLFCGDAQYANNYQNTDTTQGANDKQADGQIDENGNCLGTIYIFNGQDKRCRPPGTQTLYNDCCKKDSIELAGLVEIGSCNADEQYLAKLREWGERDGKCHYIGEYCAEKWKWPGGSVCVQKKKTFCCFTSPLARIIQEQGREQLGISWGTPKNPNCRGFTPSEFQKLDWNKIDFSEWIESEIIPNVEQNLTNTLNNTIDQIKANIETRY